MRYLIAIMLPEVIARPIRLLQRQYKSPRWKITVAPHITLVHQGDLLVKEAELASWLEAIAETITPFPLDLKGIDYFDRTFKTLLLKVSPTPPLLQLQQSLVDLIQPLLTEETSYSKEQEYRPHVTLSNRLTPEEFVRALAGLRSQVASYSFVCHNFTLLKRSPRESQWQEVKTFSFDSKHS